MNGSTAARTARNVPALLLALRQEGFTGAVTVSGSPGGTLHLERGLVLAIDTPGTPTAETLLLRSGRISEADWNAALAASAADGRLDRALIAEGAVGAAELEIVCTAAAFDGAFAMALSGPGGWQVAESATPPQLALRPGLEPQRLFDETAHRRSLLTAFWGPPGELARTRFQPAVGVGGGYADRMPRRYQQLLAAATGRNTPRDMGFALGRGLFAVMLDLARLDARRLLHAEPARPADAAPSVAPRTPPTGPPADPPTAATGPLPRRTPGQHTPGGPVTPGGPTAPDEPPIALSTEKSQP